MELEQSRPLGSTTVSDASEIDDHDADLPEQMRVRRDKRAADARRRRRAPYPVAFARTDSLAAVRERYADLPIDTATGDKVAVTGRVIFIRNSGKLCFATLREGDGTELQAMISLDKVGAEALETGSGWSTSAITWASSAR